MVSFHPDPTPDAAGERPSALLRIGTAIGIAALSALVCVVPASLRVMDDVGTQEGPPRVAIALAAAALGPMIASVLVLRGAREGLRTFAGPGAAVRAYGAGLWLAWVLVVTAVFGSVLRATTHHHALAGVTYAFGALAVVLGVAAAAARFVQILLAAPPPVARALGAGIGAVTLLALVWVALRFTRATAQDAASADAAAMVVDVLAFALCALFAARPTFAGQRALALVGPPIAFVIALLGWMALHDAPLRTAVDERAPAYSIAASLLPGL